MNYAFQNRLVGTIVLVALGVIFIPDLLQKSEEKRFVDFPELKEMPAMQYATISTSQLKEVSAVQDVVQLQSSKALPIHDKAGEALSVSPQQAKTEEATVQAIGSVAPQMSPKMRYNPLGLYK